MRTRIGVLMLVHEALERAAEVARHWHDGGCPVVIHVDSRVGLQDYKSFVSDLADLKHVHFDQRRHCEWGTWSLVEASQSAAETLLGLYDDVSHAYLASGACLPLRPIADLRAYIEARPGTDFIESVAVEEVPWAKGGLDEERFSYSFPFAWKRHRGLFDVWVSLQRLVQRRRPMPKGVKPHLGSQWWCLSRETLKKIANDPQRSELEAYFRRVWIPDESYYQTLVRLYGCKVESRSLTLSKFDFQGKPHIFYDDHIDLLRRSNCFVARKIWPDATRLYETFLSRAQDVSHELPNPSEVNRTFARAVERRTRGRDGLNSAARFPSKAHGHGLTASGYAVFQGFEHLFEAFETWTETATRLRMHKHLFAPTNAELSEGRTTFAGGLSASAPLRDYNPAAFLQSLIWNSRGEMQGFLFGPSDAQAIAKFLARDGNARVYIISGAWSVDLFRSGAPASDRRKAAARLQAREAAFLEVLARPETKARAHVWSLAEFLERPSEVLQTVVEENGRRGTTPMTEAPVMYDLSGLSTYLQELKDQGMLPHLAGDVAEVARTEGPESATRIVR